ncbi:MAG: hypothetical protein WA705_03270 [Candidatus Ozemobacteraceae bacterium]
MKAWNNVNAFVMPLPAEDRRTSKPVWEKIWYAARGNSQLAHDAFAALGETADVLHDAAPASASLEVATVLEGFLKSGFFAQLARMPNDSGTGLFVKNVWHLYVRLWRLLPAPRSIFAPALASSPVPFPAPVPVPVPVTLPTPEMVGHCFFGEMTFPIAKLHNALDAALRADWPQGVPKTLPGLFLATMEVSLKGSRKQLEQLLAVMGAQPFPDNTRREAALVAVVARFYLYLVSCRSLNPNDVLRFLREALRPDRLSLLEIIGFLHEFLVDGRHNPASISLLLKYGAAAIRRFFPRRKLLFRPVLTQFRNFVLVAGSSARGLMRSIAALVSRYPRVDLTEWVTEAARLVRLHGSTSSLARQFLDRTSDASRRFWERVEPRILFDQVSRRLNLFAAAVSEKPVIVKAPSPHLHKEHSADFWTDGRTIWVPQVFDEFPDRAVNVVLLRHGVAHECAHLEFRSFEENPPRAAVVENVFRGLFPAAPKGSQHLLKELERAQAELAREGYPVCSRDSDPAGCASITRLLHTAEIPGLLKDLWNILEDFRVDRLLYAKYHGFAQEKALVDSIDFRGMVSLERFTPLNQLTVGFAQQIRFGRQMGRIHPYVSPTFELMMRVFHQFEEMALPDTYDSVLYAGFIYVLIRNFEMSNPLSRDSLRFRVAMHGIGEYRSTVARPRNRLLDPETLRLRQKARGKGDSRGLEEEIRHRLADHHFTMILKDDGNSIREVVRFELGAETGYFSYHEWAGEKSCFLSDWCHLAEISHFEFNVPKRSGPRLFNFTKMRERLPDAPRPVSSSGEALKPVKGSSYRGTTYAFDNTPPPRLSKPRPRIIAVDFRNGGGGGGGGTGGNNGGECGGHSEALAYLTSVISVPIQKPQEPEIPPYLDWETIERSCQGLIAEVRKSFMQLRPRELVRINGLEDGPEVNQDDLFDSLMDLASGSQMSESFYVMNRVEERSVASALLLDMSPSTAEMIDGMPIFYYEKVAAYLVAEAMRCLGDAFGIFSYFDYGRLAGFYHVLKDFKDGWDRERVRRLLSFRAPAMGSSRFGMALRHTIARLKTRPEKVRVIFFFTDGMPQYDEGRGSAPPEEIWAAGRRVNLRGHTATDTATDTFSCSNEHILQDLRKCHEEALTAGIRIFCLTIDPEAAPLMSKAFGKGAIFLPKVELLPSKLLDLFRLATR